MSAPDERFAARWAQAGGAVLEALQAGRHVLLHCRAGLGRTGTVAAYLLMQMKTPAEQAIQQVRGIPWLLLLVLGGVLCGYTVAAARARRLFTSPRAIRAVNRGAGVAIAGAAVAVVAR
jgi:hypothetical protein